MNETMNTSKEVCNILPHIVQFESVLKVLPGASLKNGTQVTSSCKDGEMTVSGQHGNGVSDFETASKVETVFSDYVSTEMLQKESSSKNFQDEISVSLSNGSSSGLENNVEKVVTDFETASKVETVFSDNVSTESSSKSFQDEIPVSLSNESSSELENNVEKVVTDFEIVPSNNEEVQLQERVLTSGAEMEVTPCSKGSGMTESRLQDITASNSRNALNIDNEVDTVTLEAVKIKSQQVISSRVDMQANSCDENSEMTECKLEGITRSDSDVIRYNDKGDGTILSENFDVESLQEELSMDEKTQVNFCNTRGEIVEASLRDVADPEIDLNNDVERDTMHTETTEVETQHEKLRLEENESDDLLNGNEIESLARSVGRETLSESGLDDLQNGNETESLARSVDGEVTVSKSGLDAQSNGDTADVMTCSIDEEMVLSGFSLNDASNGDVTEAPSLGMNANMISGLDAQSNGDTVDVMSCSIDEEIVLSGFSLNDASNGDKTKATSLGMNANVTSGLDDQSNEDKTEVLSHSLDPGLDYPSNSDDRVFSSNVDAEVTLSDFLGNAETEIEESSLLTFLDIKIKEDIDESIQTRETQSSPAKAICENRNVRQEISQEELSGIVKEETFSDHEMFFDGDASLVSSDHDQITKPLDRSQTQPVYHDTNSIKLRYMWVELEDLFPEHLRKAGKGHLNTGSCSCIYCRGEYRYSENAQRLAKSSQSRKHSGNVKSKLGKNQKRQSGLGLKPCREVRKKKGVLRCDQCPLKFEEEVALNIHLKSHGKDKLAKDLKVRRKRRTENCLLQCGNAEPPIVSQNECQNSPKNQQALNSRPFRKARTKKNILRCDECPLKFETEDGLHTHMKVHIKEKHYLCKFCDERFILQSILYSHYQTVHNYDKPYKCSDCPLKFWAPSLLETHVRVHTKERPFKCKQCSADFSQQSTLNVHLRTHRSERPHKCQQCTASFKFKSNLTVHLRVHTGERPFKCELCSHKFLTATNLKNHLRAHSGEKPYQCKLCPLKFTQSSTLGAHVKNIHSDVRPYACKLCPAKFKWKTPLTAHMRMHNGEKPYKCKECPLRFTQSSTLTSHVKNIHSDVRPFACVECPAKFKWRRPLVDHMRAHNGETERPYRCELCPGRFRQKKGLIYHQKVHESEDPLSCAHCSAKYKRKMNMIYHLKHSH